MKRAIALFLSILMIFTLVACGKDEEPATTVDQVEETQNNAETKESENTFPTPTPQLPLVTVQPKPEEETRYQEPEKKWNYTNPSSYKPSTQYDYNGFDDSENLDFSQVKVPAVVTPAKKYGFLAADISTYPLSLAQSKKLTTAALKAIPIANDEMSSDELRKIVLDYFELQLTFTWTPNATLKNYPTSAVGETHQDYMNKTIEQGELYIGVPYQSTGAGNLYRWLEYYDEETGIFYLTEAIAQNGGYLYGDANTPSVEVGEEVKHPGLRAFFNQCSVASYWGWGRVINSAYFIWTADMNVRNEFIPVGFFTYPNALTIDRFGETSDYNPTKYDTNHVIRDWNKTHGSDGIYKCYAQAQPADCLVSKGHAMMVKSVNVVKKPNGTIDPNASTITVFEQIEGWGGRGVIEGVNYHLQGGVNRVYTFANLQSTNYLPFTFAEYHKEDADFWNTLDSTYHAAYDATYGEAEVTAYLKNLKDLAPVEKISISASKWKPEMTWKEVSASIVTSNYPISDIFLVVQDQVGNEVASGVYRSRQANVYSLALSRKEFDSARNKFANGLYTVTISAQVSTGELVNVGTATLIG
ncbi:MAG: hypothetical protein IKJ74_00510 [Clostridia bacterium]|nr:hypothetical protein [Clostridia bacterium]